jgi:hypothetical protein
VPDPRVEYHTRLAARRAAVQRHEVLNQRLATTRLWVVGAFVLLATLAVLDVLSVWSLAAPLLVFVIVAVLHDRMINRQRSAARAVTFYENGLARIEDRWAGTGLTGGPAPEDTHLFAADLDLFGKGSLFELMCTARTRTGRETLARWLSEPADRTEILARQEAVDELRSRLDLRERLGVSGNKDEAAPFEALMAWGTAPPAFDPRWPRVGAMMLSAVLCISWVAAVWSNAPFASIALYAALGAAALFGAYWRARVHAALKRAEDALDALAPLARVLHELEREALTSGKLVALQSPISITGPSVTDRIGRFEQLIRLSHFKRADAPATLLFLIRWQLILAPLSFLFWLTQLAFAVESWRVTHGASLAEWVRVAGEFDALSSIAGYAYEHPDDPFPEIAEAGPVFDGINLCHPLIPAAVSVPNTVRLSDGMQLLLVSGSNMSGKSTLLRTVGVNVVLALAGAPVRATRLRLSPLKMGATIRIQDSIQTSTSRFYAELQRIRRIVDLADHDQPVLFLFDELLHGTNSHDRARGAAAILRALVKRGAIGLATTHDLALAEVGDALSPHAANVHFADEFIDGRMTFDYTMRPGVAKTSNAMALMLAVGLDLEDAD